MNQNEIQKKNSKSQGLGQETKKSKTFYKSLGVEEKLKTKIKKKNPKSLVLQQEVEKKSKKSISPWTWGKKRTKSKKSFLSIICNESRHCRKL